MTREEKKKFWKKYGVPPASLEILCCTIKNLGKNGLSRKQIRSAVQNLHPKLMLNMKFDRGMRLRVVEGDLIWVRRTGWQNDTDCGRCGHKKSSHWKRTWYFDCNRCKCQQFIERKRELYEP